MMAESVRSGDGTGARSDHQQFLVEAQRLGGALGAGVELAESRWHQWLLVLVVALRRAALDIRYDNFKSEVARVQGWTREGVYANVWSVLRKLQPGG